MTHLEKATFAGGCFWCMVKPFDQYDGVLQVTSGFTGGYVVDPSYEEICYGRTGHVEAVEIAFDAEKISYQQLLAIFWQQIDPTDSAGQFIDRGDSYRPVIFYHSESQYQIAEKSKRALIDSKKFTQPITISIEPAGLFYPAERYHQDFYKKNPAYYQQYRQHSGRDQFINQHWNYSMTTEEKKQRLKALTELQYKVTQENYTETPFQNDFFNHEQEGLYVDIVSGEPLFTSMDKFDSGCGWPSFSKPVAPDVLNFKDDFSLSQARTEVRSSKADSHLGHVFNDGPTQLGGLRYCINSASLRFIPKNEMEKLGYGAYLNFFKSN